MRLLRLGGFPSCDVYYEMISFTCLFTSSKVLVQPSTELSSICCYYVYVEVEIEDPRN